MNRVETVWFSRGPLPFRAASKRFKDYMKKHQSPIVRRRCAGCLTLQPGAQALVDPSAPAEDGGASSALVAHRCVSALLAITPYAVEGSLVLPPELAARWLLAAHHPVLAPYSGSPRGAWAAVRRRGGSWTVPLARAPDAAVAVLVRTLARSEAFSTCLGKL